MFKVAKTAVKLQLGRRMLSSYETLSVTSPKDFVVHVELNRPDRLNAFNKTMWM